MLMFVIGDDGFSLIFIGLFNKIGEFSIWSKSSFFMGRSVRWENETFLGSGGFESSVLGKGILGNGEIFNDKETARVLNG